MEKQGKKLFLIKIIGLAISVLFVLLPFFSPQAVQAEGSCCNACQVSDCSLCGSYDCNPSCKSCYITDAGKCGQTCDTCQEPYSCLIGWGCDTCTENYQCNCRQTCDTCQRQVDCNCGWRHDTCKENYDCNCRQVCDTCTENYDCNCKWVWKWNLFRFAWACNTCQRQVDCNCRQVCDICQRQVDCNWRYECNRCTENYDCNCRQQCDTCQHQIECNCGLRFSTCYRSKECNCKSNTCQVTDCSLCGTQYQKCCNTCQVTDCNRCGYQNCGTSGFTDNYQCSGLIRQREWIEKGCSEGQCASSSEWVDLTAPQIDNDSDGFDDSCENYSADPCSVSAPYDNCSNALGRNCAKVDDNYCLYNCSHCGDRILNCGEECEPPGSTISCTTSDGCKGMQKCSGSCMATGSCVKEDPCCGLDCGPCQLSLFDEAGLSMRQQGALFYRIISETNKNPAETIYGVVQDKDKGERTLTILNADQIAKVKIGPEPVFIKHMFDETGRSIIGPEHIRQDPLAVIIEGDTVALGLLKEINPVIPLYEAKVVALTNKPVIIGGVVGEKYRR